MQPHILLPPSPGGDTTRDLRVAILTVQDDLHAYAVKNALERRHGVICHIVETDRFADSGGLTWAEASEVCASALPDNEGREVAVRSLDLVWWRRVNGTPQLPADIVDEAAADVIANDSRATLIGTLLNDFCGAWVNHPNATRNGELKLVQLRAAKQAGLRVPRTLVSQNPVHIRAFCAALGNQVIVKTVAGTHKAALATGKVEDDLLAAERALRLSPAVYQELIPGNRHLRVHAFGDEFYAASITSNDLDWRFNLNATVMEPYALSADLRARLASVLRHLRLRMGVFDLKLTPDGEPVWLEVNPQGQFLFIEGLAGINLTDAFADFLHREASRVATKRANLF